MRKLWKIIPAAGLVYLVSLSVAFGFQRQFMYLPPTDVPDLSETSLAGFSEQTINTVDGNEITSWWHAPEDHEPVLLFFHGNGSSIYQGRFIYQYLESHGFGVLAVEYPGYPGSTGTPSQEAIVNSALAHYDFVASQGVSSDKIYLYGTSLGAGVAAQLAAQRPVAKLVLEAPFNSMVDMAKFRAPMFAHEALVRDKFLSHEALAGLDVPILWVHGTSDLVIPLKQGQKLFDGYQGPKDKMIIEGGRHSNLWISGGRERITKFLQNDQ